MSEISSRDARRIALLSQGLARKEAFGRGKNAVRRAVEQMGYVQIDTISVVERAHHHVLKTRVPNYTSAMLDRLQRRDRALFEYWAHAAAYLPMAHYRYYLPMMAGWRRRRNPHPKLVREILARIESEGPLQSRDFEQPKGRTSKGWWDWKPAKQALEHLYLGGELMVSHRDGFQKVYDLPERVLPGDTDTTMPAHPEWIRFLAHASVSAQGIGTAVDVSYARTTLRRFTGRAVRGDIEVALEELAEEGAVERVRLGRETWYAAPEYLAQLPLRIGSRRVAILSPFDNLIINRRRTGALFAFDYQLECYLPSHKRVYGYFCLPILWGDELIGRVDAKAMRRNGLLEVRLIQLEPATRVSERLLHALKEALTDLAHANGCGEYTIARSEPANLAARLRVPTVSEYSKEI